jgi:signal recognition particle subunit SRP72
VYRELASQGAEDEEYDIRINSGATDAQLEWSGQGELAQKKKPAREDLDVFETAYNTACASIARGEFAQGNICLTRAIDRCNEAEDMSDAEKKAEILPMKVQQVYILTQMGKIDEAEKLATTIPYTE